MAMGKKITWDHRFKNDGGWYDCWFDVDGNELTIDYNFRATYKGTKIIVLRKWVEGQGSGFGGGGQVCVPEYIFDNTLAEFEIKKGEFIEVNFSESLNMFV